MTSTTLMALLLATLLVLGPLALGADRAQAEEEAPSDKTPVELGTVTWLRDHDKAFAGAREVQRPVFLLFQEVPG